MVIARVLLFLLLRSAAADSVAAMAMQIGRREFLTTGSSATVVLLGSPLLALAQENDNAFDAYQVIPDSKTLHPSLKPVQKNKLINSFPQEGVLWLGEHHNSQKDHVLQTDLIKSIHVLRSQQQQSAPMALGLEQVQVKFQPVLNDYVNGKITTDQMKELVEWNTRWQWPFDGYRPIFETARDLQIQLVALNVDSEDLSKVEKGGLPGLEPARLRQYITDPQGFSDFAKSKQFSTYVDYVIRPSYGLHEAMGILKYTMSGEKMAKDMSFRNFFSARILWDEAMASKAYAWTKEHPGGLMVGLVGADHVKFVNGIVGRYSRMASGGDMDCTSIMLNPTLIDTRPSGSVANIAGSDSSSFPDKITLQLRYVKDGVDGTSPYRNLPSNTGGVLQLADYIIVSES